MSVQIYSNSPVVSTSSDLGLYKHSIPYYNDDDATESKDQTNGAFNEITRSFDKESCSNPLYRTHPALQYAKQEPFPTDVYMTELETTSLTSHPLQFLSFDETPLSHFSAPQTYEASFWSIGTIQEISNDREQDHIKREILLMKCHLEIFES
ncbi:uncharacterized protein IAS62_001829 [Cryptococcus decagattii]|uniref:Uncharacterized protein n=1 Tax=Cryptococcus decagattii TaxID=1859122 RepID=A0ABZ2AQ65_9TREE